MAQIRLLSEEVIGKIAAGEVVERPSAAIKELIENSLDAGASAVTVEIRDGGITYFRVTDNGCGIRQNEIRMAFERHATSKITTSRDLETIGTLGFRGEALASIAAVGHVTLTTRTRDDATGIRVQNNGGSIESIEETACPEGTTIVVRDLFFNTPVRLKFLKKPVTEAGFVTELLMHMILSRPDVSFRMISNGKVVYHSVGDGQLSSAVHSIYGTQALKSMRYVDGCASGVILKGYVGIGENARGNRTQQSFFINGRMMRSPILSTALENACRERVMIGRYPICALHLTMPYDTVDVNVHPNKLEVRFRDEQGVSEAVYFLVSEALKEKDAFEKPVEMQLVKKENDRLLPPEKKPGESAVKPAVPAVPAVKNVPMPEKQPAVQTVAAGETLREKPAAVQTPVSGETRISVSERLPDLALPATGGKPVPVAGRVSPVTEVKEKAPVPKEPAVPVPVKAGTEKPETKQIPVVKPAVPETEQVPSFLPETREPVRILGALFNTYILVEYKDHLLMVDQHAVHERLLFDRLMKVYGQEEATQELLVPIVISVTRQEQNLITENQELLRGMGLTVEPFGDTEAAIRSVPMILGQAQASGFVREALAELDTGRSVTFEKKRTAILQMACKHAVKGGDALSESDLRYLVESMIDRHVTPTCPHGRPLVVSISHTEMDRKFKRIQ